MDNASTITATVFDFTKDADEPLRVEVGMHFDPNMDIIEQGGLKVVLGVGDNVACSTFTAPLNLIMALLQTAMMEHSKALNSGLVGFDKPSIIKPN